MSWENGSICLFEVDKEEEDLAKAVVGFIFFSCHTDHDEA